MKWLGVFLLPPGWVVSPSQGYPQTITRRQILCYCYSVIITITPSIKFAGTHLYTWVARGTARVKCLAQEHNTMSPARAQTQTARSGVERTNHEATAPPASHFATRYSLNILFAFQDGCQCWWFCCTWGLWWWYSWIFLSLRWAVLIPKPKKTARLQYDVDRMLIITRLEHSRFQKFVSWVIFLNLDQNCFAAVVSVLAIGHNGFPAVIALVAYVFPRL